MYLFRFAVFFFFKQKTAYEMRISDWSSDVCSSDLLQGAADGGVGAVPLTQRVAAPVHADRLCDRAVHHHHGTREIGGAEQAVHGEFGDQRRLAIGRASCRERVCQYV